MIVKNPSKSDIAPLFVFTWMIDTPGRGSPDTSDILPEIYIVWENPNKEINEKVIIK